MKQIKLGSSCINIGPWSTIPYQLTGAENVDPSVPQFIVVGLFQNRKECRFLWKYIVEFMQWSNLTNLTQSTGLFGHFSQILSTYVDRAFSCTNPHSKLQWMLDVTNPIA